MTIIKVNKTLEEKHSSSIVDYWRKNPVVAANQLLIRDGEPVELAPIQEIVLSEWWNCKFSLNTASRGMGKTYLGAVYSALQGMLYPGNKIGNFAPAFRQAKLLFNEFIKLHNESPMLQEAVDKDPTIQNDQCICVFKSPGKGREGSIFKSLPIGTDGSKIRGERVRRVLLDEFPHIPESVYRSVIQPMASTAQNPMLQVKKIKRLRELYGDNVPTESLAGDIAFIGISSGYYQFNPWWEAITNYWDHISKGSTLYNLRFTPYLELPEGFYNAAAVEDARMNAPRHVFLTEWMAEWIADSDGAFPMSLLESCRDEKVEPKGARDPDKDKGRQYVFGIDVARERDSTSIVVVELGYPSKIVWIVEMEETPFPQQAKNLFHLIDRFEPIMMYMDAFGGGQTIRDHLADPSSVGWGTQHKVIDIEESPMATGKRILKLCVPNPAFYEDANNNAKTLLEQRQIKLPTPTNPIEAKRKANVKGQTKEVDLVEELIHQTASVVVTPTATGKLHYDLPKGASAIDRPKKKDLYSAFILACTCTYDLQWKPKADTSFAEQGIVKTIEVKQNPQPNPQATLTRGGLVGIISGGSSPADNKLIIPGGGVIISRNGKKK